MTKTQMKAEWRKRNTYHPPKTEAQRNAHIDVNNIILEAGLSLIDVCPDSRELSTALTCMTLARMLANGALAVHVNAETSPEDAAEADALGKPVGLRIPESFRLTGDGNVTVEVTDTGITIGLAPPLATLVKELEMFQWTLQDYEALESRILEVLEHTPLPFKGIYNHLVYAFYKFRDNRLTAKDGFGCSDNLLRILVEERCLQRALEVLEMDGKVQREANPVISHDIHTIVWRRV